MKETGKNSRELVELLRNALSDFRFERQHSQKFFYKYSSADTAKQVLSTSKFRYSSPLIFNDPFDSQAGMHIDFEINDFVKLYFDRLEDIVLADEDPVFENSNKYSEATMMMREMRPNYGFPKDRAIETMGPIVQSLADKMVETRDSLIKNWEWNVARMRVFCVSEEPDNIQMWSHYADYHRGVVIKLKVAETEEEDDPLWLARQVEYIPKALPLFTISQVDEILGIKKSSNESLFDRFAYSKFDVWQNEKEWRVFNLEDEPNETGYNDYGFRFNKIHSIIFGCRCPEEDMKEIADITTAKKTDVDFFRANRHDYEYRLDFEKL